MTDQTITPEQKTRSERCLAALRAAIRWATPKTSEKAREAKVSARVIRNLLAYGWASTYHRILFVVTLLLLVINAIFGIAIFSVSHRPTFVVRSQGSLAERAADFFQVNSTNFDELAFYLNSVLSIKNTLTPEGNMMLPLLKGLIAPDIYHSQEMKLIGETEALRVNFITQSLVVTKVTNIVADPKSSRVGAYVIGFLVITVRNAKGGSDATTLPYRALCAVEIQPVSDLSPYPFHLVECQEKVAKDASDWDASNKP